MTDQAPKQNIPPLEALEVLLTLNNKRTIPTTLRNQEKIHSLLLYLREQKYIFPIRDVYTADSREISYSASLTKKGTDAIQGAYKFALTLFNPTPLIPNS